MSQISGVWSGATSRSGRISCAHWSVPPTTYSSVGLSATDATVTGWTANSSAPSQAQALPSSRPPHGVFDGYLAKPFQLHQLFQTLDEAMDQRRYDQTRRALQERLTEVRKRSAL
jgi:hypothetical protein